MLSPPGAEPGTPVRRPSSQQGQTSPAMSSPSRQAHADALAQADAMSQAATCAAEAAQQAASASALIASRLKPGSASAASAGAAARATATTLTWVAQTQETAAGVFFGIMSLIDESTQALKDSEAAVNAASAAAAAQRAAVAELRQQRKLGAAQRRLAAEATTELQRSEETSVMQKAERR